MSEEEIKEMFENIDTRLIIHQTIKEPISKDLDNLREFERILKVVE